MGAKTNSRDDLAALAKAEGDFVICYPKAETEQEVRQVLGLMNPAQAAGGLYVMVETARAMIELDRIASCEGVVVGSKLRWNEEGMSPDLVLV